MTFSLFYRINDTAIFHDSYIQDFQIADQVIFSIFLHIHISNASSNFLLFKPLRNLEC